MSVLHKEPPVPVSFLAGEAEALADLGPPIHCTVIDGYRFMMFSRDWFSVVGPDAPIPVKLKHFIANVIPDFDREFSVEWVTYEDALVTNFFRIL